MPKTPLTTEPIVITVRPNKPGQSPEWLASGEGRGRKFKASSGCVPDSAARNLALQHFWGGSTNAFAGPEERDAIELAPSVQKGLIFMASLKGAPAA